MPLDRRMTSRGGSYDLACKFGIAAASGSLREWGDAEAVLHELWIDLGDELAWLEARQVMYSIWKNAGRTP